MHSMIRVPSTRPRNLGPIRAMYSRMGTVQPRYGIHHQKYAKSKNPRIVFSGSKFPKCVSTGTKAHQGYAAVFSVKLSAILIEELQDLFHLSHITTSASQHLLALLVTVLVIWREERLAQAIA